MMDPLDPFGFGKYGKLEPPLPTPKEELCACEGKPPLKLMAALSYNPIHCMDCNLEVPPERVALSGALVERIAFFNGVFRAFETLWLDSGEYEAFVQKELEDIKSAVNRRGLSLRGEIDSSWRCYYCIFRDDTDGTRGPLSACPL